MMDCERIGRYIKCMITQECPDMPIDIKFSDDVVKDSIDLCVNGTLRRTLSSYDQSEYVNGLFIYPNIISQMHYIVIARSTTQNNEYVLTTAHESQHAVDMYTICKNQYCGDYNRLIASDIWQHGLLKFWCEFNARKRECVAKYSAKIELSETAILLINKWYEEVDNYSSISDKLKRRYAVARIIAEHYACKGRLKSERLKLPGILEEALAVVASYTNIMCVDWKEIKRIVESLDTSEA